MKNRAIAALLPLLSGCAGLAGPSSLVTPGGVMLEKKGTDACTSAVVDTSIDKLFHNALCASASTPADVGAARRMLTTGFALAQLRCDDFFWAKSKHQTVARVGRSAITPLVSLTSGVLALLSDKPDTLQNYLKYIALGSAATTASIDIYEEHFLFGAENIDAVRSLTMDALSEHRLAVLKADPRDFVSALMHLTDHQALCRPVHILALTRDAIKAGRIEPKNEPPAMLAARANSSTLVDLGMDHGQPPITLDEAGYLWWLHLSRPIGAIPDQDELKIIHARFSSWNGNNPVQTGPSFSVAPLPSAGTVITHLRQLDPDTLVAFGEEVRSIRAKDLAVMAAKPAEALQSISFQPADLHSFQSISVGVATDK